MRAWPLPTSLNSKWRGTLINCHENIFSELGTLILLKARQQTNQARHSDVAVESTVYVIFLT